MNIITKYKYQLLLFAVVILCYFPLTFFQSTLLNDNIDVALPVKYFAGECLQNGSLPLWNPYRIWGFPAHADLQYTNWNVEVMITGILFGYNYIVLHIQFLLYLFLAALGMFLLARHLSKDPKTGFYIACVYVLSGVMAGHAQSLVTVLGLVWMPYVILYFLKWLEEPDAKHTILVCLFSYLLVTLGYQAFAFMLAPVCIVLFMNSIVKDYKQKDSNTIKKKVLFGFAALLSLGILLSPVLVTQFQSQPFVTRLNGMSVNEVMSNPFTPLSMASFINPVLTLGHDLWFKTEVTMRNVFIGLLPLMLIFISLFKKNKTTPDYILVGFALFYLLGSFGDVLPVRKLMYYALPGFKLFRFPSLLRVVAILLLLCYWALNFKQSTEQLFTHKKLRAALLVFLSAVCVAGMCFCFKRVESFTFFKSAEPGFNQKIIHTDPLELSFYMFCVQLVLLSTAFILFNKATTLSKFKRCIAGITFVELTCMLLVYGQFTTFTNIKPSTLQANFSKMQKAFPLPSKDGLNNAKYKYTYLEGFWKNTGEFKKQLVNDDAWTSFYFGNYDYITAHLPAVKDSLQSYPFLYFSKPLTNDIPVRLPVDSGKAFIESTFHVNNADAKYQYNTFSPTHISVNVKTMQPVVLNLQQSYFTGWHVTVNGVGQPLLWNAGLLMSVVLPKGLHTVEFTYTNPLFVKSLCISYGFLLLLVIALIFLMTYTKQTKLILTGVTVLWGVILVSSFITRSPKSTALVKNGFTFNLSNSTVYYDFNSKEDVFLLRDLLKTERPRKIRYQWNNYYNTPELLYALGMDADSLYEQAQHLTGQINFMPGKEHPLTTLAFVKFDSTYKDHSFIDTTLQNGYALLLNERKNPYSKLVELNTTQLQNHNVYGYVTLKGPANSNAMVVCHVKHANGTEESTYFPLNRYLLYNNEWQKIPYYFGLSTITSTDNIKLFLMNAAKGNVFVKELKAERYR